MAPVKMSIPSFKRNKAPRLGAKDGDRVRKRERYRGSRQSRGYDRDWELLRAEYMRHVKRQCEECKRRGYLDLASDVDHIIPVQDDPELRLEWSNLQALCRQHHKGWKAKMEAYARKIGAINLLPQWCRHPETRPAQFAILKKGPLSGLFDDETQGTAADSAE